MTQDQHHETLSIVVWACVAFIVGGAILSGLGF